MAMASKEGQDADVVLPIDLVNGPRLSFSINVLESGEECPYPLSLLRFARHNGNPATRGSGSDATMLDC